MLLQKRIFEWSKTLPPWQRDLLRRLTAGPLDEKVEHEVLSILTDASSAPPPVLLDLHDLPSDEGEYGRIELRAIRDLTNINCLEPQQTLSFKPGLNAVFGGNGSGKSGYGRLLRRVTRSGEPEEILRDVFDPGSAIGPQTAKFDIAVNDVERTITIDLAGDPERTLSAISVFDASRARLFLTKPNVIEHVPRPLRLLRTLSQAQDRLAECLRERAQQRRAALPILPAVNPETGAAKALNEINANTNLSELISVMTLSVNEQERLAELEASAAAIHADQGRQLEAAANTQATNARSATQVVIEADTQMPAMTVTELASLRRRLDDVNNAERALADRAFADQRLDATGQGPWQEMWFAAERFATASGTPFPGTDENAACPLCQQDLDAQARERLQRFQEFVSSDLRLQAVDLSDQIKIRLQALPDLRSVRATVTTALRGAPDTVTVAANECLLTLDARAVAARKAAEAEPTDHSAHEVRIDALHAHADAQDALAARHAGMRDEEAQRKVMSQLNELRARVEIVDAREASSEHVNGLKEISRIETTVAKLNTQKITLKLRELQEATITERVRKAIQQEVHELDPVASRIEVKGQASKGETVIHLRFKEPCRAKVGNVLSDGEQRALSLAFFLAEVAVSDERSTIILDDPVSSLDHERRAYLAQRLAEESKRRQVIVFTHDMAFMQLVQEAANEVGIELHGQTLHRAFQRVGMVASDLPTKMLSSAKRLRTLRHRLRSEILPKHRRQDPLYEQEADRWVADLRKAYDQLIEDTVLNGTVRRFSANVQVRSLHDVKWTPQIATRIDKAMRIASPKAHHEPLALHPGPHSPAQLTAMLNEFASLYEEMGGKCTTPAENSPPTDIEPVAQTVQTQF